MPQKHPQKTQVKRYFVAAAISLLVLSGCAPKGAEPHESADTNAKQSIWERLFGTSTLDTLGAYLQQQQPLELSVEQIQALPYAAIYAETAQGSQALAVLGTVDPIGYAQDPSQPRLQWYTATDAMTTIGGRIISLEGGAGVVQQQHLANTEALDAVLCYRQAIVSGQPASSCPSQASINYDVQRHAYDHSYLKPSYQWQREQAIVSYQLAAQSSSVALKNGYTYEVRVLTETDQQGRFENFFAIELTTGTVIASRQWLGSDFGSMYYAMAKPYFGQTSSDELASRQFPYQVAQPTSSVGIVNGSKQHQMSFNELPRLDQVITALPADGSGLFYGPLTRLHSCTLDQQFEARKQGLQVKLKLLQQTYRSDGNRALEQAAQDLEQQLQQWPLRASYIHGFSVSAARRDLQHNPLLNAEQACQQAGQPSFELSLQTQTQAPQQLGLAANQQGADTDQVWVITADGQQKLVPVAGHNSNATMRALTEQANALVFRGIAQNQLPPGFKDLNQQFAQFLAHWDYRRAAE